MKNKNPQELFEEFYKKEKGVYIDFIQKYKDSKRAFKESKGFDFIKKMNEWENAIKCVEEQSNRLTAFLDMACSIGFITKKNENSENFEICKLLHDATQDAYPKKKGEEKDGRRKYFN